MKIKMLNRQFKHRSYGISKMMMVVSVLIVFSMSSISASPFNASNQVSIESNQITLSQTEAINAMTLVGPKISVNTISLLSSIDEDYYKVESSYEVNTKAGVVTVELINTVNVRTGEITTLNKRIRRNTDVITEKDNELLILYNGELITLSNIADKDNKQKLLINAIEPLVEKEKFENSVLSSNEKFFVLVKKNSNLPYKNKLIITDNYEFNVIELNDLSTFLTSDYVIKISDAKEAHIKKFIEYSKEILRAESEEKIRKLELKKTMRDVVEITQLLDYMNGDEWDVKPGQTSVYQQFVTPNDGVVKGISDDISAQEAYDFAVDWVWVSDSILHKKTEKWLLPNEFLSGTPSYSTNPAQGKAVSDCSEQANTLVSILRASGVSSEDVRVVIGKVNFDGNVGGHAWVEIKEDGKWMVLDPTCGSYYDEESKALKSRSGVNYYYWKYHPYPVDEIWAYYNDVYFTDENEEVASGWSTQYDVFTDADMYAGFISEEAVDLIFIYAVISVVAIISLLALGQIKRRRSDKK